MRITILIFLIIHLAVSFYTCKDSGFFGPFPPYEELSTYQVFSDLVFSLLILLGFIFKEVKRKSLSQTKFLACFVGTFILGSIAPMIYLVLEKEVYAD